MSIIALDWGQRFVGYASADPDGRVITPRGFFERKANPENTWILSKSDILELKKIIEAWETELCILGLPLKADGDDSEASFAARQLAVDMQERLAVKVELMDERLTSWEAKGKNNHAEAAAFILKNYFLTRSSP